MEVKLRANFFAKGRRFRRVPGGVTTIDDDLVNVLPTGAEVVVPPPGMYFDEDEDQWVQGDIDMPENAEAALAAREAFQKQLREEQQKEAEAAAQKSLGAMKVAADAQSGQAALAKEGEAAKAKPKRASK